MATSGSLAGHEQVSDAIAHPVMAHYVERLMDSEIAPLLAQAPRDPLAYAFSVRQRLANTAISDSLSRLCRNGSTKVPAHLLSAIGDSRRSGREHPLLTLAVAGWCRYLRGGFAGAPATLADPDGQRLRALARLGGHDPRRLLSDERTFGELARCPVFAQAVARDVHALDAGDPHGVIAARLAEDALPAARAA